MEIDFVNIVCAIHTIRLRKCSACGTVRAHARSFVCRFVGEFGGHGNMAAVRVAMHAALWRRGVDPLEVDPWYFPTPHEYRRLLEAVSFCFGSCTNRQQSTSNLL